MSNRELVIDLVSKLPEDAPWEDLIRELEYMRGIYEAMEQSKRGEGTPAEEIRLRIKEWVTKSS